MRDDDSERRRKQAERVFCGPTDRVQYHQPQVCIPSSTVQLLRVYLAGEKNKPSTSRREARPENEDAHLRILIDMKIQESRKEANSVRKTTYHPLCKSLESRTLKSLECDTVT